MAVVLVFLIFLPFISSSGKVFWSRWLTQSSSALETIGHWRQIYASPVTINGARATLSIYGSDEPLELATTRLKESFRPAKENCFIANERSVWMIGTAPNQILRLLALAMPEADKSLIFALSQPRSEFLKSLAAPPESDGFGHALLPGSRLETIIKNEETGTVLETRMVDSVPELVINEIAGKLSRKGWKNLYPAGNEHDAKGSFLVFQRAEALCTVMVGPALCENKSCVTILIKEIAR